MTKIKLLEVFSSKVCCHVDTENEQDNLNFNITNSQLKELNSLDLTSTKVIIHEDNSKCDEYMYYKFLDILAKSIFNNT